MGIWYILRRLIWSLEFTPHEDQGRICANSICVSTSISICHLLNSSAWNQNATTVAVHLFYVQCHLVFYYKNERPRSQNESSRMQLRISLIFLRFMGWGGVGWNWDHLARRPPVCLLYPPRMIDEYGKLGGIRIWRANWSTRRKPAPVPLCAPQITHDFTWDRTRAAAAGSWRLTAWAMVRPISLSL
jgi:hypothetical protein